MYDTKKPVNQTGPIKIIEHYYSYEYGKNLNLLGKNTKDFYLTKTQKTTDGRLYFKLLNKKNTYSILKHLYLFNCKEKFNCCLINYLLIDNNLNIYHNNESLSFHNTHGDSRTITCFCTLCRFLLDIAILSPNFGNGKELN